MSAKHTPRSFPELSPMSFEDWDYFACQAVFLRFMENPRSTIEWALSLYVQTLNDHTHFAMAEMDDLFENPSVVGFNRIESVLSLFKAIGWARGVETLSPYMKLYVSKQRRTV